MVRPSLDFEHRSLMDFDPPRGQRLAGSLTSLSRGAGGMDPAGRRPAVIRRSEREGEREPTRAMRSGEAGVHWFLGTRLEPPSSADRAKVQRPGGRTQALAAMKALALPSCWQSSEGAYSDGLPRAHREYAGDDPRACGGSRRRRHSGAAGLGTGYSSAARRRPFCGVASGFRHRHATTTSRPQVGIGEGYRILRPLSAGR